MAPLLKISAFILPCSRSKSGRNAQRRSTRNIKIQLKTNKIKEGTPVTWKPETPLILNGHSVRDEIKYGTSSDICLLCNQIYSGAASQETLTSLAKCSPWWSCEERSRTSSPFTPPLGRTLICCLWALQHSPTSASHNLVNSTLNKYLIKKKKVQPQEPISLLLPSPTRAIILEKSFGFLPSFHVNLETT